MLSAPPCQDVQRKFLVGCFTWLLAGHKATESHGLENARMTAAPLSVLSKPAVGDRNASELSLHDNRDATCLPRLSGALALQPSVLLR